MEPGNDLKADFQVELRIRLSDNSYHWNILRAKGQHDDHSNILGWVVTVIDIQDQKRMNEVLEERVEQRTQELKRINHALELSNDDLQQFASVASHDLQEPLRKIHLYSNMLNDQYPDVLGDGVLHLQKILASTRRMKSIISNILNYSKLSADNLKFEPTDIKALIAEIVDDLEVAIEEKGAAISVSDFPIIETTPGQIRQVFQNMIGNALKFTKPGVKPVINITAELTDGLSPDARPDPQGSFCRIVVQDNGIGFNAKFALSIFNLFHRLHSKDVYEGTGIGLAIAKKIIEKHNGRVTATSEDGKGATFIITIPVHH